MKVRELMKDAPVLPVLLDRCFSTDYSVDRYDFFYMQALSERDKKRFENFNPSDGHWYGASVCVAGGLLNSELIRREYKTEIIDWNKQWVDHILEVELNAHKGILKRRDAGENQKLLEEQVKKLKSIPISVKAVASTMRADWLVQAKEFLRSCGGGKSSEVFGHIDSLVYNEVDFSSPVFADTQIFLPFIERRDSSPSEAGRLARRHLHDVYPWAGHFYYMGFPDDFFKGKCQ